MFKKIIKYFVSRKEYNEAKKALILMLLNQYSDLMTAQQKLVEEQIKTTEILSDFNSNVSMDNIKEFMSDVKKFDPTVLVGKKNADV